MKVFKSFNFKLYIQKNMPWAILLFIIIVFSIISPDFLTLNNIVNILNQNSYVIIVSLGISLIMISGDMDLSVGYQMSIIGIVSAILMKEYHVPTGAVIIAALILGILLNFINIILVFKLKLTLLIVSIGTMTIFQGISFVISQSKAYSSFPRDFKLLGQGYVGPVPVPIILMLILFAIMNIFLRKTYMGRFIYALGGNEKAARLAGINVKNVKMMIAVIVGLLVALSTLMLIARLGSAQSMIGPGTEFTVINGVLLGGVSIRGGEGKLSGVVAGILTMSVLGNGMQLSGMGTYAQYIVKGMIMLTAIGIDVYQSKHRDTMKKAEIDRVK